MYLFVGQTCLDLLQIKIESWSQSFHSSSRAWTSLGSSLDAFGYRQPFHSQAIPLQKQLVKHREWNNWHQCRWIDTVTILFSFFSFLFSLFSLLSIFLIEQLLKSKNLFCKSCLQHLKPRGRLLSKPGWPFWSTLLAILYFTMSDCPHCC